MTALLVPAIELAKPMKESDLPITGIICLFVYKRNEIIITIKFYYCQFRYQDFGNLLQHIVWDHYMLLHLAIYIYIVVIGDLFTKFFESVAFSSIEANTIAQVFLDNLIF